MHKLMLNKPILDSNNKEVKELIFDFNDLKIDDAVNAEILYFSITQSLGEVVLYRCTTTFKLNLFFIACQQFNKDLSYINFLNIKGRDKDNISKIIDKFYFPEEIMNKKKETS